eukprot:7132932-Prymnesium_polylepis.2
MPPPHPRARSAAPSSALDVSARRAATDMALGSRLESHVAGCRPPYHWGTPQRPTYRSLICALRAAVQVSICACSRSR